MTSRTASTKNPTEVTRPSDLELVVTRVFDAPVELVFEAWRRADLFQRWWVPKALGVPLRACEMDVRTGGHYRLEFGLDAANAMAFYGRYIEVTPPSRIVWTNEESGETGAVTTVTFEDLDGKTRLVLSELYPTSEACDEALQGSAAGLPGQFEQLDELLPELA